MSDFVSYTGFLSLSLSLELCATTPTQLLLTLCCWFVVSCSRMPKSALRREECAQWPSRDSAFSLAGGGFGRSICQLLSDMHQETKKIQ